MKTLMGGFRRLGAAALIVCWLLPSAAPAAPAERDDERIVTRSPLRVIESRPGDIVARLSLDLAAYRRMKSGRQFLIRDFALSRERRVDVRLRRVEVFSRGARIVLGTATGDVPLGRPDVLLLAGRVVDDSDSTVFLGLSPHGSNGLIHFADETFVVSSGGLPDETDTVVYNLTALPPGTIVWREFRCWTDAVPAPPNVHLAPVDGGSGAPSRGETPCRIVDIAVETDWAFTASLFGFVQIPGGGIVGNTDASSAYAATLVGAVSEIYARDLNVRLQISFLRVWAIADDPWDAPDIGEQLNQFRIYWNANMSGVQRDLAHFLSGRPLGGGVAYFPGFCNPGWGYGASVVAGSFPYPLQNNHGQNWDPFVVSHEIGHNVGTHHTHCYDPPIDRCWDTDDYCPGSIRICQYGTIMSYCHTCPGGMANIMLEFHPRVINEGILPYLESVACDITADAPTIAEHPLGQTSCIGDTVTFTVAATGPGAISYQWRKDGIGIPGATAESYAIAAVAAADAGVYDVVVTNPCGSQTSSGATLIVFSEVIGDFEPDCDVDLDDFAVFAACYAGSVRPPADTCPAGADADLDNDGDVDLDDFAIFAANYTGAM